MSNNFVYDTESCIWWLLVVHLFPFHKLLSVNLAIKWITFNCNFENKCFLIYMYMNRCICIFPMFILPFLDLSICYCWVPSHKSFWILKKYLLSMVLVNCSDITENKFQYKNTCNFKTLSSQLYASFYFAGKTVRKLLMMGCLSVNYERNIKSLHVNKMWYISESLNCPENARYIVR